MKGRRPILVTGALRSGTSWVGTCLCSAPGLVYLNEQFNPDFNRPGICDALWLRPFTHVTRENEAGYRPAVESMLGFRYSPLRALRAVRGLRDLAEVAREWFDFWRWRRRRAVPVMKDPLAIFSAEWLAERFGARVVCMIRHPAGFFSSIKRIGTWHFDFRLLVEQPLLMKNLLSDYASEIRACAERHPGLADATILLYRVFYGVIEAYRKRHPDWAFVRLEDLALDPAEGFRRLFGALGLPLTDATRSWIAKSSSRDNPAEAPLSDLGYRYLNSRANASIWRERLSADEIARVKAGTADVWPRFYREEDWA
jgi:hypothetical protein